jgi:hypothetical protein
MQLKSKNKSLFLDEWQFGETGLYRQLLVRRKVQPIGLISRVTKYAWWGLILIPAMVTQNMFFSMIAMTAVFFVPLIVSLSVILWFLPVNTMRDIDTGILPFMFASPVPTSDIVSSLRSFYGYNSLKLLLPFIIYLCAFQCNRGFRPSR